jgi:hypothetical protein
VESVAVYVGLCEDPSRRVVEALVDCWDVTSRTSALGQAGLVVMGACVCLCVTICLSVWREMIMCGDVRGDACLCHGACIPAYLMAHFISFLILTL